jgi:uncharacterized protein
MTSYLLSRPINGSENEIEQYANPGTMFAVLKQETSQQGTPVMKVRAVCFLLILFGMLGAFPSIVLSQPEFGCRKVGNATEKHLCDDADLARLDRRLERLYRGEMDHYLEDSFSCVRSDQENWFAQRDKCGEDSKCIAQRYQEQIQRLSGQNPDYPLAGVFHVQKQGHDMEGFALYPLSPGKYYIEIQIEYEDARLPAGAGTFVCDLNGFARNDGNGLRITARTVSGDFIFPVSSPDPGTLVLKQSPELGAAEKGGCSNRMRPRSEDVTYSRRGQFYNWPDDAYKQAKAKEEGGE